MRYPVLAALVCAVFLAAVADVFSADAVPVPNTTPAKLRIAILGDNLPGDDSALPKSLEAALSSQADVSVLTVNSLALGLSKAPAAFDMVVFPNAVYLPVRLKDPLISFLKSGGDMLVIGGPAFSQVGESSYGKWEPSPVPEGSPIGAPSPVLESLSPSYKTYKVTAAKLTPNKTYATWALASDVSGPIEVVSPIWRSQGLGIGTTHSSRWIPLIFAVDSKGERRGTAAALRINSGKDFPDSLWGYIGFSGEANRDTITNAASKLVARMSAGVFLKNAGTDKFGYFVGQDVTIGGEVLHREKLVKPTLRLRIKSSVGPVTVDKMMPLPVPTDPAAPADHAAFIWNAEYAGSYTAVVELMDNGKPIDVITHEFTVADPVRNPANTVSIKDGDFYLNGQKWHPLGVNYWPRYVAGLEQEDKWGEWLDPERYDPEIVEQDLKSIKELGMNVVSVQYSKLSYAPAMIDFLERCRLHGLKAHVYVEGLHPLNRAKTLPGINLIKAARLNESDTVFAYDVGWEVHVGPRERRNQWDKDWQNWIINRYGSVANAEKDWNYVMEARNGVVTGPTDDQLKTDGDWRVMVAAYRRFWDDTISREYGRVRREIRKIDPVHLIGARSGYGGTGQMAIVDKFPFDLASGVKHLDYVSPEAWGLADDWQGMQAGGFHTLYARFASKGKPVFWAEYGKSIWPKNDQEQIDQQAAFYKNFYRMLNESGASGGAGWWWAGGLRVGEKTDFGMINPDGTIRPAAPLAKETMAKLAAQKAAMQANNFITIDRDKYVTGYAGIWTAAKEDYLKMLSSGSTPGLKTEGTGANSLNIPLVAVGNTPLNGNNPPKYVNAEFNKVSIYTMLKRNVEVEEGLTYHVDPRYPVKAKVSVGNTGEAEWLALPAGQEGAVALTVTTAGGKVYRVPLPRNIKTFEDVELDITGVIPPVKKPTPVTLQMEATGRGTFGDKVSLVVAP